MKRWLLVAAVVAYVVLRGGVLLPRRLFYRDRRPTRLGRIVNDVTASVYGALPLPGMASLETRGRRTGLVHAIPVAVATYDDERYLVSMLGERSGWVPNIRAAGGHAVLRHGRRRPIQLEEVPVGDRAPIIKAYLRIAPGARPHIKANMNDPIEAFERVAADHPVFRIIQANPAPASRATPAL